MAHLVFADTRAILKNQKSHFFSNAIEKHFVILSKSSRFNFQDNGNKLWRVYQKT